MQAFYCTISGKCVGPITGVELREAALAGIVGPSTSIANAPGSQWMPASKAHGLFSESGNVLPHPAGTSVPTWYVKMPKGEEGPYHLHQLLQFCQKGELDIKSEVRRGSSTEYVAIKDVSSLLRLSLAKNGAGREASSSQNAKWSIQGREDSGGANRTGIAASSGAKHDPTTLTDADGISEDEILGILGKASGAHWPTLGVLI